MVIINFSDHELTAYQRERITQLATEPITREVRRRVQFDESALETQVTAVLASLDLTAAEWETAVVYLPGLAAGAAVLLAKWHGLTGHFPTILRIVPEAMGVRTRYGVGEAIDLQGIRARARKDRLITE